MLTGRRFVTPLNGGGRLKPNVPERRNERTVSRRDQDVGVW